MIPHAAPSAGFSRWVHLDVLRGIAILLVLGAHTPFRLPDETFGHGFYDLWRRLGWVGVDLFFVLSGFLIGGLLFAEHRRHGGIHFGRFLLRRTLKIWPAYLVFLAAAFAWDVRYAPDHSAGLLTRIGASAHAIWPYLIHVQNYLDTPMIERIGHAWSLAVEEHFYLLLPLLLLGMGWWAHRRKRVTGGPPVTPFRSLPWIGLGLAIVCLGLRCHAWQTSVEFDEFKLHWPTHLRIDSLFAGVVLAYAVQFSRGWIESLRPWRWAILGGGVGCFAPFAWIPLTTGFACTIGFTLLAIGSMALVLAAWFQSVPSPHPAIHFAAEPPIALGIAQRCLLAITLVLAKVGERSYSIYLWHMPFTVPVVMKLHGRTGNMGLWGSRWHYSVVTGIYVLGAIGLGSILFALVEAPSVALRDRWFPSRSRFEAKRREILAKDPSRKLHLPSPDSSEQLRPAV